MLSSHCGHGREHRRCLVEPDRTLGCYFLHCSFERVYIVIVTWNYIEPLVVFLHCSFERESALSLLLCGNRLNFYGFSCTVVLRESALLLLRGIPLNFRVVCCCCFLHCSFERLCCRCYVNSIELNE